MWVCGALGPLSRGFSAGRRSRSRRLSWMALRSSRGVQPTTRRPTSQEHRSFRHPQGLQSAVEVGQVGLQGDARFGVGELALLEQCAEGAGGESGQAVARPGWRGF